MFVALRFIHYFSLLLKIVAYLRELQFSFLKNRPKKNILNKYNTSRRLISKFKAFHFMLFNF